jgi:hypothetical protein
MLSCHSQLVSALSFGNKRRESARFLTIFKRNKAIAQPRAGQHDAHCSSLEIIAQLRFLQRGWTDRKGRQKAPPLCLSCARKPAQWTAQRGGRRKRRYSNNNEEVFDAGGVESETMAKSFRSPKGNSMFFVDSPPSCVRPLGRDTNGKCMCLPAVSQTHHDRQPFSSSSCSRWDRSSAGCRGCRLCCSRC